jgi:hypothetical protein
VLLLHGGAIEERLGVGYINEYNSLMMLHGPCRSLFGPVFNEVMVNNDPLYSADNYARLER